MPLPLTDRFKLLDLIIDLQGQDGGWNRSPYDHGMFIGLSLARNTIEGFEVETGFRRPPAAWLEKAVG